MKKLVKLLDIEAGNCFKDYYGIPYIVCAPNEIDTSNLSLSHVIVMNLDTGKLHLVHNNLLVEPVDVEYTCYRDNWLSDNEQLSKIYSKIGWYAFILAIGALVIVNIYKEFIQ